MSQNKRILLGLGFAQLVCLAFGLWIQDRLLVATARWQSKQRVASVSPAGNAANVELGTASATPIDMTAQSLLESMPVTRVITWLWIGLLQVVVGYLTLARLQRDTSEDQRQCKAELQRRSRDLVRTRNAVVFGLAKLADYRDQETGQHLERIALYSTRLAAALRKHPRYRHQIDATFVKTIGISSALHDIGKVSIEDAILRKPGPLAPAERARMQEHTEIGADCIRQIEARLGNCNFLQMSRQIAQFHHEHWDGRGYGTGTAGDAIPLAARIVAVADVYDALSVKRCYKEAIPHDQCVEIIRAGAGTQFDPVIVEVFLTIEADFRETSQRFADAFSSAGATDQPSHRPRQGHDAKLLNALIGAEEESLEVLTGAI